MRKLLPLSVLWLALWVGPAGAAEIYRVNAGAVGTQIVNYDGFYPVLSTHQTIAAAFTTAAGGGDTIYVSPGSYDEAFNTGLSISSGDVLTGLTTTTLDSLGVTVITRQGRSEIRYTGTSYQWQLPAVTVDGAKCRYIRFEQANATDRNGIQVRDSKNFRFESCWFEGNYANIFTEGFGNATKGAQGFTVDACSLGVTPAAAVTVSPFYFIDSPTTGQISCVGCSFTNNIIDFSAYTDATSNFAYIFFAAARSLTFSGNTVTFGTHTSNNPTFLMQLRSSAGNGTYWSQTDSVLIADNTFSVPDMNNAGASFLVKMLLVGDPQNLRRASNVNNVRVLRNSFIGPLSTDEPLAYHAIEAESLFTHTAGDSAQYYLNNIFIGYNAFFGTWRLAAGLQDNARFCAIVGNYALSASTAVTGNYAAWAFGGARWSSITNNYSEGWYGGIALDAAGNSVALKNYGNRAVANTFKGPDHAFYLDLNDATPDRPDSLFYSMGNVAFGETSWVLVDSLTVADAPRQIAWWRSAYIPPQVMALTAAYAGDLAAPLGGFSFGDMDYTEDPAALKGARALPYGMFHALGNSGIGIQP